MMNRREAMGSFLAATLVAARSARSVMAQAAAPAATLTIGGDVPKPITITLADLKTMPRASASIEEDGRTVKYEGVRVAELLKRAGGPLGSDLRGKAVASYVLASGSDGYQAVFSLGELDPDFSPNDIIVADSVDGKPLFDYQGPFRIVAPHDRAGARGVRMLTKLELVRLRK
jgi:DMSO/TMAO reductase YedYZ molybdopterin-dependent catalytic subunit